MSKKIKSKVSITKIKNFLEEKSDNLPVVYDNGGLVNSFTLRNSALAWAVASLQGQQTEAQLVEAQDLKFSRFANDSMIFHQRYRTANDEFRKDLMYIRYEESEYHKNYVREQLDETIKKIKIN